MNIKYLLGCLFLTPLLPIMYLQARRIRSSIPDLPEATGPQGSTQNGFSERLRVISIGESTVAGVGVDTHQEGFSGTFAQELSTALKVEIDWRVYGKSGFTAKDVRKLIIPTIEEKSADLIVIGLGGNDTFQLNTPGRWRKHINELIDDLHSKFSATPILFSNMPPVRQFPAFTPLMQFTLGNLIEILGDELEELTQELNNVYYYPRKVSLEDWRDRLGIEADISEYFSDGVHPSKLTYQVLAKDLANFLLQETDLKDKLISPRISSS